MKITPVDITHKTFQKKMFGLDEAEVMDFLSQTATQMEDLIRERNAFKDAIRERDLALHDFKQRDESLKATITSASHMTDRLRQDAEREAKLILADAQQKADAITRDSRDSLKKIYQEIADLKRMKMQFEANLRAMAQAHLSLIETGDKFMPGIGLQNATIESSSKNPEISPLSSR